MVNAPPPPTPPQTPLWRLGFRFESIGNRLYTLYDNIRDIWLIGTHLSWPFYLLSVLFIQCRDLSWELENKVSYLLQWVTGIVEGNTLIDLIDRISTHLQWIRRDPIGWLSYHIRYVSIEIREIIENPRNWLERNLFDRFPSIRNILYSSSDWVIEQITRRISFFHNFIHNPLYMITNWVTQRFPWIPQLDNLRENFIIDLIVRRYGWFYDFLNNPSTVIVSFISYLYPSLITFFNSPILWIKQKIAETLNISLDDLNHFPRYLTFTIISHLSLCDNSFIDQLTSLFCDIILRFI